jgi:hypothetical protein
MKEMHYQPLMSNYVSLAILDKPAISATLSKGLPLSHNTKPCVCSNQRASTISSL